MLITGLAMVICIIYDKNLQKKQTKNKTKNKQKTNKLTN